MTAFIDLTGKQFGKWTILKRAFNDKSRHALRKIQITNIMVDGESRFVLSGMMPQRFLNGL